jgi:hypothetical protein
MKSIKNYEIYDGVPSAPNRHYLKRSFDINGLITEQVGEFDGNKSIMKYEKNGKVKEIEKLNNDGTVEVLKNDGSEIFREYDNSPPKDKQIKIDSKGRRYYFVEDHRICDGCYPKKKLFVFDKIGNTIEFQDMLSKDSHKETFEIDYFKNNFSLPKILYQNSGYYRFR